MVTFCPVLCTLSVDFIGFRLYQTDYRTGLSKLLLLFCDQNISDARATLDVGVSRRIVLRDTQLPNSQLMCGL
jgi:hypothetical protein